MLTPTIPADLGGDKPTTSRAEATDATSDDSNRAVDAAVEFVAVQPGASDRILSRHYPTRCGTCAGCATASTRYPCLAACIAELAQKHPLYRTTGDGSSVLPVTPPALTTPRTTR